MELADKIGFHVEDAFDSLVFCSITYHLVRYTAGRLLGTIRLTAVREIGMGVPRWREIIAKSSGTGAIANGRGVRVQKRHHFSW